MQVKKGESIISLEGTLTGLTIGNSTVNVSQNEVKNLRSR